MDAQDRVARVVAEHELAAPPAYRILDLASEVGEVAKEAAVASDYGEQPEGVEIAEDEVGDVLFALLALCDELDIDAEAALDTAITKYESRIDAGGDPGSTTG